jgi:hypothetical protein
LADEAAELLGEGLEAEFLGVVFEGERIDGGCERREQETTREEGANRNQETDAPVIPAKAGTQRLLLGKGTGSRRSPG